MARITVADDIVTFLKNNSPRRYMPIEVAIALQHNVNTIRGRMSEMSRSGEITRHIDGGYCYGLPVDCANA